MVLDPALHLEGCCSRHSTVVAGEVVELDAAARVVVDGGHEALSRAASHDLDHPCYGCGMDDLTTGCDWALVLAFEHLLRFGLASLRFKAERYGYLLAAFLFRLN